jgi:signal transduction histidine kinase
VKVEGTLARVSVRDQGPGLTAIQQQRIWERFYQAGTLVTQGSEQSGLGLGLSIVKAIVEQHQGQVGVESQPDQGSTFWFSLPLAN